MRILVLTFSDPAQLSLLLLRRVGNACDGAVGIVTFDTYRISNL